MRWVPSCKSRKNNKKNRSNLALDKEKARNEQRLTRKKLLTTQAVVIKFLQIFYTGQDLALYYEEQTDRLDESQQPGRISPQPHHICISDWLSGFNFQRRISDHGTRNPFKRIFNPLALPVRRGDRYCSKTKDSSIFLSYTGSVNRLQCSLINGTLAPSPRKSSDKLGVSSNHRSLQR